MRMIKILAWIEEELTNLYLLRSFGQFKTLWKAQSVFFNVVPSRLPQACTSRAGWLGCEKKKEICEIWRGMWCLNVVRCRRSSEGWLSCGLNQNTLYLCIKFLIKWKSSKSRLNWKKLGKSGSCGINYIYMKKIYSSSIMIILKVTRCTHFKVGNKLNLCMF